MSRRAPGQVRAGSATSPTKWRVATERFYLRASASTAVLSTTLVFVVLTVVTTASLQAVLESGFGRGYWIGVGTAVAVPLLLVPPVTLFVVRLIHGLDEAHQVAARLASTDSLTGLRTRRSFFDESNRALDRAEDAHEPIALLIADIDWFKKVNDRYGHLAGDRVILEVARTFRSVLRSRDIVARYGGEELIVMLPGTDLSQAEALADRLRRTVANLPVPVSNSPSASTISVTVSIGIAQLTPGQGMDEFFHNADRALYAAKAAGRNRVRTSSREAG